MNRFHPLFLFLILFSQVVQSAPVVVLEAVGQVGSDLVSSRQVRLSEMIDRWNLLPPESRKRLTEESIRPWRAEEKSEEFKSQVSTLLLQIMLTKEAESLGTAPDDVGQDQAVALELIKDLSAAKSWKQLEAKQEEVVKMVRMKRLASEFLKLKTESGAGSVSEADLKAYYSRNKSKLAGVSYDLVKPVIRERLQQENQVTHLRDWFEILKRKYNVQYFSL